MARLAAVAKAYYYPTPDELMPSMARLVSVPARTRPIVLDLCAGTGRAVVRLAEAWGVEKSRIYAVELSKARYDSLESALRDSRGYYITHHALHGDSFRVTFDPEFAAVMFFNPPYDTDSASRVADRDYGRLEARWLARWSRAVARGGVLLAVLPHYALASMADQLATEYEELGVYRFPDPHYQIYKQVVVIGRRRGVDACDPTAATWLRRISDDCSDAPVLGDLAVPVEVRAESVYCPEWRVDPVDVTALAAAHRPWTRRDRRGRVVPMRGTLGEVADLNEAPPAYTSIMPVAEAHVATAIAAGVFDGVVLDPDDIAGGLPTVVIRGSYTRTWVQTGRRESKTGACYGIEETQVPELDIHAVDLVRGKAYTLRRTVEQTYSPGDDPPLETFSCGDLLTYYGAGIRRAFRDRCRPVYDPATETEPLAVVPARPLYRRQDELLRGLTRARRRGRRGVVLAGETGTGKTSIGATWLAEICAERGGGRVLVIAPRHIVYEWVNNQIPTILGPGVDVREIASVSDVDAWLSGPEPDRMSVGVLARTTAKLGPRIVGVAGRCPKCGAESPEPVAKRGTRRTRCAATRNVPRDALSMVGASLVHHLAAVMPSAAALDGRWRPRQKERLVARTPGPSDVAAMRRAFWRMLELRADVDNLVYAAAASGDGFFDEVADRFVEDLGDPTARTTVKILRAVLASAPDVVQSRCRMAEAAAGISASWSAGRALRAGIPADQVYATAATAIIASGSWENVECGEPLFRVECDERSDEYLASFLARQDGRVPAPMDRGRRALKRVPLMKYIHSRYRDKIVGAISDEAHEAKNADSAQSQADQLLYQLGCPFLCMTGSISDGYPRSLHVALWFTCPWYRDDFRINEAGKFQLAYGYNRRVLEDVGSDGKVVEYGSMSGARRRVQVLPAAAPDIVPTAVLRYVVGTAATIALDDLDVDVPPCRERVVAVPPAAAQNDAYRYLLADTKAAAKRDIWTERRGALLGALGKVPTALDRMPADVGNCTTGGYEVRYGEKWGSELVCRTDGTPRNEVLPKEHALLQLLTEHADDDRNTMVLVSSVGDDDVAERSLAARLLELVRGAGHSAVFMSSSRVPPAVRIRWIQEHVVDAGVRVLLVHPKAVETGINNLVWFSRVVFFEDPNSSPICRRQVRGRVVRPGQTRDTEIVSLVYTGTHQEVAHDHLMRKVASGQSTDGLSPLEALRSINAADESTVVATDMARMILAE